MALATKLHRLTIFLCSNLEPCHPCSRFRRKAAVRPARFEKPHALEFGRHAVARPIDREFHARRSKVLARPFRRLVRGPAGRGRPSFGAGLPDRAPRGWRALPEGTAWGDGFTLAQRACFPKTEPLATAAFDGVHLVQAGLLAAALGVSLVAAAVALSAWQRTRGEHTGGGQTLMAIGEGRSRFMAFVGLLTSCGFSVAILFSAPAVLFVPAC
jgi:hypothetical protein